MTIQQQLNQIAIDYLPKVKKILAHSQQFEANQMINATIQACINSSASIDSMNLKELEIFENDLIKSFKLKNWVN